MGTPPLFGHILALYDPPDDISMLPLPTTAHPLLAVHVTRPLRFLSMMRNESDVPLELRAYFSKYRNDIDGVLWKAPITSDRTVDLSCSDDIDIDSIVNRLCALKVLYFANYPYNVGNLFRRIDHEYRHRSLQNAGKRQQSQ